MSDNENKTGLSTISATIKQYLQLLVEDTRLNIAEKLTRLLAGIALASLLTIIIISALLFASISAGTGAFTGNEPCMGIYNRSGIFSAAYSTAYCIPHAVACQPHSPLHLTFTAART